MRPRILKRIAAGVLAGVIGVAAGTPAARGQCADLSVNPTGSWPGEGNGTDVVAGRNATLNGATFGTGLVGQAFVFDGINDDASVADDPALDVGTGDFTIEFWVNPDSDGGEVVPVEKWDDPTGTGWTISDRGGIYFAGSGGASIQTANQITPLTWQHIALRRSSGTVGLFRNGTQVGSTSAGANFSNSVPLLFGRRRGGQGFFWDGKVDEIHYFVGTALSNAEIQAIHAAGSDGLCPLNECGDNATEGGEQCDDGNTDDGDGCDSNCTITGCGNGIVTAGEQCDDDNGVDGDGCDNDCTISCGNSVVTPPETCDDGNLINGDGCESDCTASGPCAPIPGDLTAWWPGDGGPADIQGGFNATARNGAGFVPGRVRLGFALDGNNDFIDVADDDALDVGNGDFTVDLWVRFNDTGGEQVLIEKWVETFATETTTGWTLTKLSDNSVRLATPDDNLDTDSLPLAAGTWYHFALRRTADVATILLNGAEIASATIAGNLSSDSSLKFGHRGSLFDTPGSLDTRGFHLNGHIDEVHLVVGRGMSNSEIQAIHAAGGSGFCVPAATCGNGIVEAGEPCDDGNMTNGDGCESDCTASCGNGTTDAGEACDDGNGSNGDGCDTNCTVSACGNGVVAGSETCEDGNQLDGDGCDNNCTETDCGNGIVTAGETCDDGNPDDGDGCEHDCSITTVAEAAPPGGTVSTDPGNNGATPQAPIQTYLTTPGGGMVSIASSDQPLTPGNVQALVQSLLIDAPPATVDAPLVIAIRIDASAIPSGLDLLHVTLTRDGEILPDCSGAPGTAEPDPCIASRVLEGDGDVTITGLTSHASEWSAVAHGLFKAEQSCVNGAAKNGVAVAKAQAKLNAACLKLAAKGEIVDPQGCLAADAEGKVQESQQKSSDFAAATCSPAPPFGFSSAAAINAAAEGSAVALVADLFGANLNNTFATGDGAKCQSAALKSAQKLFALNVGLFLKCQKVGLKGDPTPFVATPELATCLDDLATHAKRLKSVSKFGKTIAKKCAGDFAALLPGTCSGASNPGHCLATRVACRVCQQLNAVGNLQRDCDLRDDFVANASCS